MAKLTLVLLFLLATIHCALPTFGRSRLRNRPTYLWSRGRSSSRTPTSFRSQSISPGLMSIVNRLQPSRRGRLIWVLDQTSRPRPHTLNLIAPSCAGSPRVCSLGKYRTADGSCNNIHHPTWGSAGQPQARLLPSMYADGKQKPRTTDKIGLPLPSARDVSQVLHTSDRRNLTESAHLSHLFTVWGQFLDHDITHTPVTREADGSSLDCCNEPVMYPRRDVYWLSSSSSSTQQASASKSSCFPIRLNPSRDRFFTTNCMNFVRSKPFAPTASCPSVTREQGSTQTAYIDASQVYGSSLTGQLGLRSGIGGRLVSSAHDLLSENATTMCNMRPNTGDFCFASGDPRVNEHPMLSSLHVVFHRLHNSLATQLSHINPHWDDEKLYQEARKIVGAIMQHVTYAEYLPLVLGDEEMTRHDLMHDGAIPFQYDPNTNPAMINSFTTAAFRFGHSMVNGLNSYGFQKLNLRDMFFHPNLVQHDRGAGLVLVLNGLIRDHAQDGDRHMSKDLTDHLFQTKTGRSLDLASLNIQRGRDHGLPPFNDFRQACGLLGLEDALAMGKFPGVPFSQVYRHLDDVDLFTGGLSEHHVRGGVVGPTFACIIGHQFRNIKFGDRFWFENTEHPGAFTGDQIKTIREISLADILCLTTGMTAVQVLPFTLPSFGNPAKECSGVSPIDLSDWLEAP